MDGAAGSLKRLAVAVNRKPRGGEKSLEFHGVSTSPNFPFSAARKKFLVADPPSLTLRATMYDSQMNTSPQRERGTRGQGPETQAALHLA
jgi:hypothetical protein